MCTSSKQINVFLVIVFFIFFLLSSFFIFSTVNKPDEILAGCNANEFSCRRNDSQTKPFCILRSFVCDGKIDCPLEEDEDETNCDELTPKLFKIEEWVKKYNITPKSNAPEMDNGSNNLTDEETNFTETGTSCYESIKRCNLKNNQTICCNRFSLTSFPENLNTGVKVIQLNYNNITELDKKYFQHFTELEILGMNFNQIFKLDNDLFNSNLKLRRLFLDGNRLIRIEDKLISNLTELEVIYFRRNQLNYFNLKSLKSLVKLNILMLSHNKLKFEGQIFPELKHLKIVNLANNEIQEITKFTFQKLANLKELDLRHNKILSLSSNSFVSNFGLRHLFLSYNQLADSQISSEPFRTLENLTIIDLSHNPFNNLPQDLFKNNAELISIKLEDLTIYNITVDHFKIPKLKFIYFSHFRYCMYVKNVNVCKPFTDQVSSLENLIALPSLRILVWSVGILIVLLNFMVLFLRSNSTKDKKEICVFVKSLSISDSLIGFYMLAIASFDVRFANTYHEVALEFVNSWQCTGLGALAVFSKQFSLFIVLLISFNRNRSITFIYYELRSIYLYFLIFIGFFLSLFIALFPVLFFSKNNIYFNANMLCYPLHLAEPYLFGWQYNAVVNFINLPIIILIIFLYAHMYFMVIKNRRFTKPVLNFNITKQNIKKKPFDSSNNLCLHSTPPIASTNNISNAKINHSQFDPEELELALRLFFIVGTDCICWLPVVVIKILALFDFKIPALLNAWIIIIILPLNCILNPIIYNYFWWITAPIHPSESFRKNLTIFKMRIISIFRNSTKNSDMTRKSSSSYELRTSNGLQHNALNSSQITMQCLDRKSSKSSNEQEMCDFTTSYFDVNNNGENLMSMNHSLLRSSTSTIKSNKLLET